ncbi:unnamed protein product [Calypogeia fissa]
MWFDVISHEYAVFWQEMWALEDDVVFSHLDQFSDYEEPASDQSPPSCLDSPSAPQSAYVPTGPAWNSSVPSFALMTPLGNRHAAATRSHARTIALVILWAFSPGLVWLPHDLMLDSLLSFSGPWRLWIARLGASAATLDGLVVYIGSDGVFSSLDSGSAFLGASGP